MEALPMTETIVYIDRSDIRPGKVEELELGVSRLVEFIRAREPQLLFYGFSIDRAASSMTVVAVHPDSASIELHLRIGGPEFRKLADCIDLRSIELYGRPSETVLQLLDEKARALGEGGSVVVHDLHAAFGRTGVDRVDP
jgi:hypothetical protein